MVTVDQILTAVHQVQRRAYRTGPLVFRCSPQAHYQLQMAVAERPGNFYGEHHGRFGPPGANIPDYFDPRPGLLGLTVHTDEHLPPDVWRICDDDDTLLYDCREGTHALGDERPGRGYGPAPREVYAPGRRLTTDLAAWWRKVHARFLAGDR